MMSREVTLTYKPGQTEGPGPSVGPAVSLPCRRQAPRTYCLIENGTPLEAAFRRLLPAMGCPVDVSLRYLSHACELRVATRR